MCNKNSCNICKINDLQERITNLEIELSSAHDDAEYFRQESNNAKTELRRNDKRWERLNQLAQSAIHDKDRAITTLQCEIDRLRNFINQERGVMDKLREKDAQYIERYETWLNEVDRLFTNMIEKKNITSTTSLNSQQVCIL